MQVRQPTWFRAVPMGKMNGRTAVPISGANKQSYTIKNATADDGGSYRVTATNEHGSVSSKAANHRCFL